MNKPLIPNQQQEIEDSKTYFAATLIAIVSRFLDIPSFIVLHKALPDPDWALNLDRIVLFLLLLLR